MNKTVIFKTNFYEDTNQANISKIITWDGDDKFPTPIHSNYLAEEFPTPKLNSVIIKGQFLSIAEKDIFLNQHEILKTLDGYDIENFEIILHSSKISSYKKLRHWCEIPYSQKNFGIMDIEYDKVGSKISNDNQFFISFHIMLKPSEFKDVTKKLINKNDNVEYNFFFKVKINFDRPKINTMGAYSNEIIDFSYKKMPTL